MIKVLTDLDLPVRPEPTPRHTMTNSIVGGSRYALGRYAKLSIATQTGHSATETASHIAAAQMSSCDRGGGAASRCVNSIGDINRYMVLLRHAV